MGGTTVGACSGTNNKACVAAPSGNYGCGCATDNDCQATEWCKKGAGATQASCQPQIGNGAACSDANCNVTGCLQCSRGGGSACPGTTC
jgi:hypothetical protein